MTRVAVVDDHAIVRGGLVALLSARPGIQVAGEAGTAAEAVALIDRLVTTEEGVDVVLMDLNLGTGEGGVAATRTILARHRDVRVVVLTTFDADADILDALAAGASGYMLKDSPVEELVAAIERAEPTSPALSTSVQARVVARAIRPDDQLSPRELEILAALAQGASNRQLAKELFISESTVKTHLAHLFAKLGVDNRTAAVAEGRRRRLVR
ncbi:response regulator transcription factor [Luteococcus sanguinis]|uniref:LuxR C-terminal-related transcriptional regulator n=1 Tax=Luteococcus sanguinis TaxID=174038 RepID=A0ABW1X3F1_9ACTN